MNISDKGIWLYYNKKGSLISKIQHGEVVRQKGSFDLRIAFEDPKVLEGKKAWIAFKAPGSNISNFSALGTDETLDTSIFKKIKATEMTYGLEDGKQYNVFAYNVASDSGYTQKYGTMTVLIKLTDKEDMSVVSFQGSVQLYIEPTYGKEEDNTTITKTEYEELVNDITNKLSEKLAKYGDTATKTTFVGTINAKTNYELDEQKNQKISTDSNSPKTHIKVYEPQDNDDVTNKLYVDEIVRTEINKIKAENIESKDGTIQLDLDELESRLDNLNASQIKTSKQNKNIQEVLDDFSNDLKKQNHFKGIKNDITLFDKFDEYKSGDYCIVAKQGSQDILYIWDDGEGRWFEKGPYDLSVKTVNLELPDDNGNINLTSEDIEFSNDVSIKDKMLEMDGEILRFKGDWRLYKTYNKNDIVADLGNLYICYTTHESDRNPMFDSRWILFVEGFSGDYNELKNVPEDLKDFKNDGDGTDGSKYATESYVNENGGKINTLSVNGEQVDIDANKNINITLPTVIKLG